MRNFLRAPTPTWLFLLVAALLLADPCHAAPRWIQSAIDKESIVDH